MPRPAVAPCGLHECNVILRNNFRAWVVAHQRMGLPAASPETLGAASSRNPTPLRVRLVLASWPPLAPVPSNRAPLTSSSRPPCVCRRWPSGLRTSYPSCCCSYGSSSSATLAVSTYRSRRRGYRNRPRGWRNGACAVGLLGVALALACDRALGRSAISATPYAALQATTVEPRPTSAHVVTRCTVHTTLRTNLSVLIRPTCVVPPD